MANAIYHNKYGRPSHYSMFSLIDESDDGEQQSYYSILFDLFNNKVINLNKFRCMCLLC